MLAEDVDKEAYVQLNYHTKSSKVDVLWNIGREKLYPADGYKVTVSAQGKSQTFYTKKSSKALSIPDGAYKQVAITPYVLIKNGKTKIYGKPCHVTVYGILKKVYALKNGARFEAKWKANKYTKSYTLIAAKDRVKSNGKWMLKGIYEITFTNARKAKTYSHEIPKKKYKYFYVIPYHTLSSVWYSKNTVMD